MSFGTKDWANGQLRFAISELRDASIKGDFQWKNTLFLVLYLKERLVDQGFSWQAKTIDFWIHRYLGIRRRRTAA
jgi:hypothetical protein